VVPSKGSVLDLAAANWNTVLGAACFLACAIATLVGGSSAAGRQAATTARGSNGPMV
jgi:hypothetical protein